MALTFTVDLGDLDALLERAEKARVDAKPAIFGAVLQVANELDARIDSDMPVDTGRAAAGWGKYKPAHLSKGAVRTPKGNFITRPSRRTQLPQVSSPADAIWEEHPDGLYVVEGTHVPYVEKLNEGSSTQAPAGFIDLNVEWAAQVLPARAAEALTAVLEKL